MLYSCPLILSKSVSYPRYNLVKHSINSTDPSSFSFFFSSSFSFSFSFFFCSLNTFTKKRKNPVNIIVLTYYYIYSIKRTSSLDPRICIERVSRPPGALRHLSILGPALSSRTPHLPGAVAEFSTVHEFSRTRGKAAREEKEKLSERVCH